MPKVLMKSGETKEIPEEQMLSFLQENRKLIRYRFSPRRRQIKNE